MCVGGGRLQRGEQDCRRPPVGDRDRPEAFTCATAYPPACPHLPALTFPPTRPPPCSGRFDLKLRLFKPRSASLMQVRVRVPPPRSVTLMHVRAWIGETGRGRASTCQSLPDRSPTHSMSAPSALSHLPSPELHCVDDGDAG